MFVATQIVFIFAPAFTGSQYPGKARHQADYKLTAR